jgi:hypothetical protein
MLVLTSPPDLTAVIATITPHSSPPPFFTTTLLHAHSSRPFFTTALACHFLALALFAARAVLPVPFAAAIQAHESAWVGSSGWFFRRRSRVQHACRATFSMFCHQYPWFGFRVSRRCDVPSHDAMPTPVQFL